MSFPSSFNMEQSTTNVLEGVLGFIFLLAVRCFNVHPAVMIHPLYTTYFVSAAVLGGFLKEIGLQFPEGLHAVMTSDTPPTIAWFKSLPTAYLSKNVTAWGVYVLVLEKALCRPRVYIGSGTHSILGVKNRAKNYDNDTSVPQNVRNSLKEGYKIEHKGLLC